MTHKISISGEIGWEVEAKDVRNQLKEAKGKDVLAEINTPGGSVFQGIEIYNLLRDYKGKVTTRNISMAGSMGSYIMLAGDVREAYDNSTHFVHYASGGVFGNRFEHERMARTLLGLDNMFIEKNVEKTGQSRDAIEAFFKDETYFFGNEILENGFVDRIIKSESDDKTDRESAVAVAQAAFAALGDKAKVSNLSDDYEKIAALLKPEAGTGEPPPGTQQRESVNQPITEEKIMNWEEFIKTPEAQAKIDALLKAEKELGVKDGETLATEKIKAEFTAKVAKITNIMDSEAYDKKHKKLAVKALKNEITMEMFDIMISMYDTDLEELASAAAASETTETGDTAADSTEGAVDGKAKNATDMKQITAELKSQMI